MGGRCRKGGSCSAATASRSPPCALAESRCQPCVLAAHAVRGCSCPQASIRTATVEHFRLVQPWFQMDLLSRESRSQQKQRMRTGEKRTSLVLYHWNVYGSRVARSLGAAGGTKGAVSTKWVRRHVPPVLSIQNEPKSGNAALTWSKKRLPSTWAPETSCPPPPPLPPSQLRAGVPSGLTFQAAEFARPQLAQAALAIAVDRWLRARVSESCKVQELRPRLRRLAGHDPGLPAARSGPGRAGPEKCPGWPARIPPPPRPGRASPPAGGTRSAAEGRRSGDRPRRRTEFHFFPARFPHGGGGRECPFWL